MSTQGKPVDDPLREVDMAIDEEGDLMEIDAAGHAMIVQPAAVWTGKTASEEV